MAKTYTSQEYSDLFKELARERKANKLAVAAEAANLTHLFRGDEDHLTDVDWEVLCILADSRPPSDDTKAAVRAIVERNKAIHFDAMRVAEMRQSIMDLQAKDRLTLVS